MGVVDEGLELLGCAKAAGSRKEVADMVAKGAIVGVLLDCHDLYAVVA